METKEAIEFLEYIITIASENYNEESIEKRDQIIELLQRGKKFEEIFLEIFNENKKLWQMWEEFKESFGKCKKSLLMD